MKKILLLLPLLTTQIFVFGQKKDPELFPVNDRKVGYLGYYLEDGTKVVEPQFCSASYNTNGYYLVSKAEHKYTADGRRIEEHIEGTEKYGLLNSKGAFIIRFEDGYNAVTTENGFIKVAKNNLYGIVNEKKEVLIPMEYEELFAINSATIVAKKHCKMGIVDIHHQIKVPFVFDIIFQHTEDIPISTAIFYDDIPPYFIVKQGEQYGVINSNGAYIIEPNNSVILYLTKQSVIVNQGKTFGLLDYQSKVILPFKPYDYVEYFGGNEIKFIKDNEEHIYDTKGKFLRKVKIEFMEKSPSY